MKQHELWSPNLIGWHYRPAQATEAQVAGLAGRSREGQPPGSRTVRPDEHEVKMLGIAGRGLAAPLTPLRCTARRRSGGEPEVATNGTSQKNRVGESVPAFCEALLHDGGWAKTGDWNPMAAEHRFLRFILSAKALAVVRAGTKRWLAECRCGHKRDVWDSGGVRFLAAGKPRRLGSCPACGRFTLYTIRKKTEAEKREMP